MKNQEDAAIAWLRDAADRIPVDPAYEHFAATNTTEMEAMSDEDAVETDDPRRPGPSRGSRFLVAASILAVIVGGVFTLTRLGNTTEAVSHVPSQAPAAGDELTQFRPDIPAREVPSAEVGNDPAVSLSDNDIAHLKWLISTMTDDDAERELAKLAEYANADPETQEELSTKAMPQIGDRSILDIPGVGAGWLEVDQFGPDSVNETTGRGIVYEGSTGTATIGEYDGKLFYDSEGNDPINVHPDFSKPVE